ncbi:GH24131 [Drosophila grimshawi]|uniref:GH24131 n=2 Tax=Drosophila grimshawi TaxID=7222 RepID=B4JNI8_DROGR|nr:GH24131 [Drosophila grimshawi]
MRPQGFAIEELRQILSQSELKNITQFIHTSDNVLELIDGFMQLMAREEIDFGVQTLAGLHVAGIMIYMLHHDDLDSTQMQRMKFIQRCFDYLACTEDKHVHELCTQILCLLDLNDSQHVLNTINCCRIASPLSTMAQLVCTCLLWAMLDNLTDLGFDTYRLRAYPDIMMAVAMVNPLLYLQDYPQSLNLIVRIIGALLLIGPYGCTEKLRLEMGLPQQMLEFPESDAAVLFRWLTAISEELRYELQLQDGHGQDLMVILEISYEVMKLVHSHLSAFYQRLYYQPDCDADGCVSDHQYEDHDDNFDWFL